VSADVSGRTVTVEGEVRGNIRGQEQIVLKATAQVEGNIQAPRVTVEDGAAFRGSIDMGRDPIGSGDAGSAKPGAGKPAMPEKPPATEAKPGSQAPAGGTGPGGQIGTNKPAGDRPGG